MARTEKVAPPRNQLPKVPLYKNSRATELRNLDPEYHYEWLDVDDPQHPSYAPSRTVPHEIGNERTGFAFIDEPWEPVSATNGRNVERVDARTDQGGSVDTVHRHGRMVLHRIKKSEYAKYKAVEDAMQAAISQSIFAPEQKRMGKESVTTVVTDDVNAETEELLRKAGHKL